MKAAEQGIWKSAEMRRRLADAGLEISAGKMSGWWTGTPISVRLDELDIICFVLGCSPAELLICEPEKLSARPAPPEALPLAAGEVRVKPRLGRHRTLPPA